VYQITIMATCQKLSTTDFVDLNLTDGSGTTISSRVEYIASTYYYTAMLVWTETGLSGTITRQAMISAVSGTVSVNNGFARNAILIVQDIGAA
jgi:hypothetical protein